MKPKTHRPFYLDIADHEEDQRITIIGHAATCEKKIVAFIVEDDVKANRYLDKLKKKYPGIKVLERGNGPVIGTVFVKVGPNMSPMGAA
jgi:hypothetical protein